MKTWAVLLSCANRMRALAALGRTAASQELAAKLAGLEPEPPYFFFDRGRAALDAGDLQSARSWFIR